MPGLTFPHGIFRQLLDYPQLLRYLVTGELVFQRPPHVHGTPRLAPSSALRMYGIQHDDCCHFLAPLFRGDADDCGV